MWKYLNVSPPILWIQSLIFQKICHIFWDEISLLSHEISLLMQQNFANKNSSYINQIAQSRGITRLNYESLNSFQNRVNFAFAFLKYSSTLTGISHIISKITKKPFTIRELYQETWILGNKTEKLGETTILGDRKNKSYFIVEFIHLSQKEKAYISEVIHIYKPAHVGFHINISK